MARKIFGVNPQIYLLGLVSFFTDVSSEMIFSVFAVFFTIILGASTVLLGLVEGAADFSSCALDYVAGLLSDRAGRRKRYALIGYGFSTIAKILLIVASSTVIASFFRVLERLGKSFRGPPRDAWIASVTTVKNRGISFGIHKTFDKLGAVLGPLIAYAALSAWGTTSSSFHAIFLIALVPAALSVIILIFLKDSKEVPTKREPLFASFKQTSSEFKHFLGTAGIFSLAYFSFGFLLLKAYKVGFAIKDVVLLYALFNVAFVLVAAPIGKLGDIIGRRTIIALEYIVYALMSLGFIFASQKWEVVALFVLFGVFYAIDESQTKAYITDFEKTSRATAIGLYNFFTGLVYLPASLIAGWLWMINPNYAFVFASLISLLALGYFLVIKPHTARRRQAVVNH